MKSFLVLLLVLLIALPSVFAYRDSGVSDEFLVKVRGSYGDKVSGVHDVIRGRKVREVCVQIRGNYLDYESPGKLNPRLVKKRMRVKEGFDALAERRRELLRLY